MTLSAISKLITNEYNNTGAYVSHVGPDLLEVVLPHDYPAATSLFVDIAALNGEIDMLHSTSETRLIVTVHANSSDVQTSRPVRWKWLVVAASFLGACCMVIGKTFFTTVPTYQYKHY
jgi:hypothetical protein